MKEFLRQNIIAVIGFTLIVGGAYVTLNDLKGNTVSKQVYEAEKTQWQKELKELKEDGKKDRELLNQIVTDVALINLNVKHLRSEWDGSNAQ